VLRRFHGKRMPATAAGIFLWMTLLQSSFGLGLRTWLRSSFFQRLSFLRTFRPHSEVVVPLPCDGRSCLRPWILLRADGVVVCSCVLPPIDLVHWIFGLICSSYRISGCPFVTGRTCCWRRLNFHYWRPNSRCRSRPMRLSFRPDHLRCRRLSLLPSRCPIARLVRLVRSGLHPARTGRTIQPALHFGRLGLGRLARSRRRHCWNLPWCFRCSLA
jgi:hypothetical protein